MSDSPPVYGIIDPDYARIFTMARVLAWQEGYALLFHGSFTRDLDLIAVPWTKAACNPEHLVVRIAEASDLNILGKQNAEETKHGSPKEHGRRAWTLTFKAFGDPRFIDFSIMPGIDASLKERVTLLETVIAEDLNPNDCADEVNADIVEEIHKRFDGVDQSPPDLLRDTVEARG